jgi:hypothetical protein
MVAISTVFLPVHKLGQRLKDLTYDGLKKLTAAVKILRISRICFEGYKHQCSAHQERLEYCVKRLFHLKKITGMRF